MADVMIVPVNVAIKRYYRCYAHVDSDANDDLIIEQIKDDIISHQDDALTNDPELFIEEDDIFGIDIDHDASWKEP